MARRSIMTQRQLLEASVKLDGRPLRHFYSPAARQRRARLQLAGTRSGAARIFPTRRSIPRPAPATASFAPRDKSLLAGFKVTAAATSCQPAPGARRISYEFDVVELFVRNAKSASRLITNRTEPTTRPCKSIAITAPGNDFGRTERLHA